MKSKNWRQYSWYRPPPLSYVTPDDDLRRQADEYKQWLLASGRIKLDPAELKRKLAAEIEHAREALTEAEAQYAEALAERDRVRGAHPRRYVNAFVQRRYDSAAKWLRSARVRLETLETEGLDRVAELDEKLSRYIAAGKFESGGLISACEDREATAIRTETWLSLRCRIRVVRCHSRASNEVYGELVGDLFGEKPRISYSRWCKFPKPDAVTTYSVMVDGRCAETFLSLARAKAWAKAQQLAA